MNTSLFYRRRAERFSQLIDETEGPRPSDHPAGADQQLTTLVSLTRRVSDLPVIVESHQEFRDGLRAVLMATIEREGIGATARTKPAEDPESLREKIAAAAERRRTQRRARVFGAVVASLAAAALGFSGVSVASGMSMPGETLYPLKRQAERAQLAVTGSDTSKGQLYLDFASTRLDEAKAVTDDPASFRDILDDMDADTRRGVALLVDTAIERRDPAALKVIDTFVSDQRRAISRLDEGLTGVNKDRAAESAALVERVHDRSTALRPLLGCGSDAINGEDDLGHTLRPGCEGTKGPGGKVPTSTAPPAPASAKTTPANQPPTTAASAGAGKAQVQQSPGPSPSATPLDGASLRGNPDDITGGSQG